MRKVKNEKKILENVVFVERKAFLLQKSWKRCSFHDIIYKENKWISEAKRE